MKTQQEILAQQILTREDIETLFHIKKSRASMLMREIRKVSNIIGIQGIVHIDDYWAYIEHQRETRGARCLKKLPSIDKHEAIKEGV